MESETACRLKQWDRERVHQLKEKEEEEDKKAWDKMYKIQVKAIFEEYDLFGLQWCSRMFTLTVRRNIRGCIKKGL